MSIAGRILAGSQFTASSKEKVRRRWRGQLCQVQFVDDLIEGRFARFASISPQRQALAPGDRVLSLKPVIRETLRWMSPTYFAARSGRRAISVAQIAMKDCSNHGRARR